MKLETYADIKQKLANKKDWKVHLLLGNGFSIAYDKDIFSYNALSRYVEDKGADILKQLFSIIKDKNFEVILQQLDVFYGIADIFGIDIATKEKIKAVSNELQLALIEAVKELHPDYVFKILDESSKKCYSFLTEYLSNGGNIFTTNYDLLLYWVLMRQKKDGDSIVDGFGRDAENIDGDEFIPPEEIEYSELRWGKHKAEQNIHYLHGALPLFDTNIEIIKEEYDGYNYLLENIQKRFESKHYPIFVTSGDGQDKLKQIMHNKYLSFCYEQLTNVVGSLVTFGFNFGEYDDHIISAINIAAKHGRKITDKLWSIYIGVYSDEDKKHIKSIENKFDCKVHIYDARDVAIWR